MKKRHSFLSFLFIMIISFYPQIVHSEQSIFSDEQKETLAKNISLLAEYTEKLNNFENDYRAVKKTEDLSSSEECSKMLAHTILIMTDAMFIESIN
ncbi:MAG: hypothetical protein PVG39_11225, partial [Desulfobacteraceae bacterium]